MRTTDLFKNKAWQFLSFLAKYVAPKEPDLPPLPYDPWRDFGTELPTDGYYWFSYKRGPNCPESYPVFDENWTESVPVIVRNGSFGDFRHVGAGHWYLKATDLKKGFIIARWHHIYHVKSPTEKA